MRTPISILLAVCFGLVACTDPAPQPEADEEITVAWQDTYTYDATWQHLQPVCNSEGIDDDRCKCLLDLMVAEVGVDGAMYVAISGWMHDDEAAALKDDIGEQRANRANDIYAFEQDITCVQAGDDEGEPSGEMAIAGEAAADDAGD